MLYATSIRRSQPAKSSALIWEPGAGQRWVRSGDVIGSCTVDQIHRGRITYRHQAGSAEMSIMSLPPGDDSLHHRVVTAAHTTEQKAADLPYAPRTYNENQRGTLSDSVGNSSLPDPGPGPRSPAESQVLSASEFPEAP